MDSSSSNGKREQESGDITKPSAKKQKLGERKSDVEVEGDSGYLIPLRLTARSGYLAVEEVARLLLFTGKTFMGNIFGDLQNNLGQTIPSITGGTPRIADVGPFRYVHNVEVIRNAETEVFGFQIHPLASREKDSIGCQIVKAQPLLQSSSVIEKDDVITSINGKDVRGWTFSNTVKEIHAIHGTIASISIRRFHPGVKMQIWKCICQHKWRASKALTQLMQSIGERCSNGEADWEGLFQKFCQKKKSRHKCDASDNFDFLVSMHNHGGASLDSAAVACLVIAKKYSKHLIRKGSSGWLQFDSPIKLGIFACSKDIRKELRKWSVGLHILRKMDKKTRKVDLQLLDAKKFISSKNKSDCGEGKRNLHYFTRKRGPVKGVVVCGNLTDLINDGRIRSKVDIDFKRNLRYCTVEHNDGKKEISIDAVSVSALIRIGSMDERERTHFSKHDKVKSGVTLAKFLARADGWE